MPQERRLFTFSSDPLSTVVLAWEGVVPAGEPANTARRLLSGQGRRRLPQPAATLELDPPCSVGHVELLPPYLHYFSGCNNGEGG